MKPRSKKKATSPGLSLKNIIIVTYVLIFGVVMLYGSVTWRYAPVRERNGQYVDKRGTAYSAEDYRRFVLWERLMLTMGFGGIAVGIVGGVAGQLLKSRRERAGATGGSP